MLEIFVDGDACPVKDETYDVALRYGVRVTARGAEGQASTAGNINIDIDQNFLGFKNATDEEFFINMFGVSKEHFKKKRVDRFVNPADVNELYTDGGLNQARQFRTTG